MTLHCSFSFSYSNTYTHQWNLGYSPRALRQTSASVLYPWDTKKKAKLPTFQFLTNMGQILGNRLMWWDLRGKGSMDNSINAWSYTHIFMYVFKRENRFSMSYNNQMFIGTALKQTTILSATFSDRTLWGKKEMMHDYTATQKKLEFSIHVAPSKARKCI